MTATATQPDTLTIAVNFGTVSLQKTTCRVGLKFRADSTGITERALNKYFNGARCRVTMRVDPNASGDIPGQEVMEGMEGDVYESVIDINGYSKKGQDISTGMTFSEGDWSSLGKFHHEVGYITLERIGDAGDDDGESDADGEDDADQQTFDTEEGE